MPESSIVYVITTKERDKFYCGENKPTTGYLVFAEKYVSKAGAEFVRQNVMHPKRAEEFYVILPVRISVEILENGEKNALEM